MPRVVEVINFLHELDLLEAHLDEHQHFIDKIVVVESKTTYSGMSKPLILHENLERFKKYNFEYHEIPIDIFTLIPGHYDESERKKWYDARRNNREAQQAYMFAKFKHLGDYICNSDVDEIWSKETWEGGIHRCMEEDFAYIAPKMKTFFHYVDAPGSTRAHWRIAKSTMNSHVRQKGIKRGNSYGKVGISRLYIKPLKSVSAGPRPKVGQGPGFSLHFIFPPCKT